MVDHHYVAALKRRRDKVGEWAVRDVGGEDGRGVRSLKRMCIDCEFLISGTEAC